MVKKEWEKKNIARWQEIWDSEDFKKKQAIGKLNRRRGDENAHALPTHTAGSRSHLYTHEALETQHDMPVYYPELHEHTHTRKHKKELWITPWDQEVQEDYNAIVDTLTQNPETHRTISSSR